MRLNHLFQVSTFTNSNFEDMIRNATEYGDALTKQLQSLGIFEATVVDLPKLNRLAAAVTVSVFL